MRFVYLCVHLCVLVTFVSQWFVIQFVRIDIVYENRTHTHTHTHCFITMLNCTIAVHRVAIQPVCLFICHTCEFCVESICLSVCLSHAGTVSQHMPGSCSLQELYFSAMWAVFMKECSMWVSNKGWIQKMQFSSFTWACPKRWEVRPQLALITSKSRIWLFDVHSKLMTLYDPVLPLHSSPFVKMFFFQSHLDGKVCIKTHIMAIKNVGLVFTTDQ